MQLRSNPFRLPSSKRFKAIFHVFTIIVHSNYEEDCSAASPCICLLVCNHSQQRRQGDLLKTESAVDSRACCARALSLISIKFHKSMWARRSEITARFLKWKYPHMLFLAEDCSRGQDPQADGSDCSISLAAAGPRGARRKENSTICHRSDK